MILTLIWLVFGLVVLTIGAEFLVRGSSRLAVGVGISPLVVGLTVVAFGTSAPELVVSVQSAFSGNPDVAVGNVVGSNILNVLLILGLSAMIVPLRVEQRLIRFDVPLMIGLSIAMWLLGSDGQYSRWDGLLLFGCLIAYNSWAVLSSRKESVRIQKEYEAEYGPIEKSFRWSILLRNLALLIVGLVFLVLGARWFVDSAVVLAKLMGLTELVIGLTIVALGTSLPEVATSVVAAIKGERDIAVGNVVGSNLFNIMAVLGISSLVAPAGIAVSSAAFWADIPVMIAVAIACLPIFFTGSVINRANGVLFFAYYCAYTAALLLTAMGNGWSPTFNFFLLWFALPLTFLGLGASAWWEWKILQKRGRSSAEEQAGSALPKDTP
ncbi:MAG: calcium/sodium antiporter [Blastopirellula sp.]|nr:calcium/sodium antiporter [Blastopirellula sp.]